MKARQRADERAQPAARRGQDRCGNFSRGDTVSIVTETGSEIARGLVAYDAGDASTIAGRKSSEIVGLLGLGRPR
jgi:glutamate 5-kinase